jgi:hypothetical protein
MPKKQVSRNDRAQSLSDEEKAEMGLENMKDSSASTNMKTDETSPKKTDSNNYDLAMSISEEEKVELTGIDSPGTYSDIAKKKKKKKTHSTTEAVVAQRIDLSSSTLDKKSKHSKHHSSRHSKSSSNGSEKYSEHDKTMVTFGEYEFVVPKDKLPLLKVMACAVVLLVSIFIDEGIYASKYRYGIILAVVAFLGAIIGVVIPTKKAMHLNYFISVVTYAGACLNTIDPGPFTQPGNGYFASW